MNTYIENCKKVKKVIGIYNVENGINREKRESEREIFLEVR